TDEVVVALGGVELDREAARVPPGVRAALLTGDSGEPDQHLGLRPRLEQRGAGVGRDVLLGDERAERTAALGVHDPLRDPLAVELRELLHGVVVVQHDRAGVADRLGVRVAGDRGSGGGGGHVSHACLLSSCWFLDRVSWSGTAPVRVVSWSRVASSVRVVSSSGTAAQAAQIPWKSTSAARIRIPPSSEGVRHGAWPTTQETSSTAPHRTHITWWWLSPVRVSYRAGDPGVTSLRSRPSSVRSASTWYTDCAVSPGSAACARSSTVSAVACGLSCTTSSTVRRCRVTRRPRACSAWDQAARGTVSVLDVMSPS